MSNIALMVHCPDYAIHGAQYCGVLYTHVPVFEVLLCIVAQVLSAVLPWLAHSDQIKL